MTAIYPVNVCFSSSTHLPEFLQITVRPILVLYAVTEHASHDSSRFLSILKQEPEPFMQKTQTYIITHLPEIV